MILLDTSALLKRYVAEPGSAVVARLMDEDSDWAASDLARVETGIALCRRALPGDVDASVLRRLAEDWDRFTTVPVDQDCLAAAVDIGCRYLVPTADAIHLAAARRMPSDVRFLSFDRQQVEAAISLGLSVSATDE